MEYLEGGSLADRLARAGRLGWQGGASIGVKLAGALDAAHASGVTHRDIKPANVLLSAYGEVKLGDFGIARVADLNGETGRSRTVSGTPAHAAPEVIGGEHQDERADAYSLGSTLFCLVAGHAPFLRPGEDGVSLFTLLRRVTTEEPPDLCSYGAPSELAALVARCLAKDPALRPSAAEIGAGLQAVERAHAPASIAPATTGAVTPSTVAAPASPAGHWVGSWDEDVRGDRYRLVADLDVDAGRRVSATFTWTIERTSVAREQPGWTAVEAVAGTWDPASGSVVLSGTVGEDPNRFLVADTYTLAYSSPDSTLRGRTSTIVSGEPWTGTLTARR